MKKIVSPLILLFSVNLAFASLSFAECHLGSDGNNYCGDVCALNSDGTWSCYDDDRNHPDTRPVECHLGSDGNQYCGHDCGLNSDGTWGCD